MIKPSVGPYYNCVPIAREQFWGELARLFTENAYARLIEVRYRGCLCGKDDVTGEEFTCFYGYEVVMTTVPDKLPDPTINYAELTTTRYYAVWMNAPKE